jgi:hypothetical protein
LNYDLLKLFSIPLGAATVENLSDEHVWYQMRDFMSGTMLWPTSTTSTFSPAPDLT